MKKRLAICLALLVCVFHVAVMTVEASVTDPIAGDKAGIEPMISANIVDEDMVRSKIAVTEEEEIYANLNKTAVETLRELLSEKPIAALIYLCDSYGLREEADENSAVMLPLPSGQTVFIQDIYINEQGKIWYKVSTFVNEQECSGYVEREYLAYSDETFIQWENEIIAPEIMVKTMEGSRAAQDVAQFPESYRSALQAIKSQHPNWTFVRMNTGLDWNTVISNEVGERSLVPSSSPETWKNGNYDRIWAYATEEILKYYMDPRNFLNDTGIFQFEQLTYNASYHTQNAVQAILSNTFMAGSIPNDGRAYAKAFWEIGNNLRVSPFHLACRVYQEQGPGTSPLISGTYSGYEGLYNYFNIGATGNTTQAVVTSGLNRARKENWTTRYASLSGGAKVISANYILMGQDTLYLQKFDVDKSHNGLYWHQYMQNICAPDSESKNIKKAYSNTNSLNNTFVFKIPVYGNMPSNACGKPGEVTTDTTQIKAFVSRLYEVALGRPCDENGLAYWTQELAQKKKNGAEVAKGFILSKEMEYRYLNNEQFVDMLYQTFFDRMPQANDSGKKFWINLLENGVSRAYVFRGFCHSNEFTAICGRYGIVRGSIVLAENRDQKHNITMYVYRCYDRTLGRQPDVKGLNYWTGELIAKRKTASQVAGNFVFSKEFVNRKFSDEEFIKIMYRMFFDREFDNAGLGFWLNELESGNRDRYGVFTGFANSKEFRGVLDSFGL